MLIPPHLNCFTHEGLLGAVWLPVVLLGGLGTLVVRLLLIDTSLPIFMNVFSLVVLKIREQSEGGSHQRLQLLVIHIATLAVLLMIRRYFVGGCHTLGLLDIELEGNIYIINVA